MKTGAVRGLGMVLKFAILMIVLVVMIVAGVLVPLLLGMRPREQRMLANGLQNRATILLDSIAARAAEPVRTGVSGYAAISAFPSEIAAMQGEALSITISGPGDPARSGAPEVEDPLDRDYLWATNDPNYAGTTIASAQQTVQGSALESARVREIAGSVNAAAADALTGLPRIGGTSDEQARVGERLQAVAADTRHTGSIPPFDPEHLSDTYLFYRPIVTVDEGGGFFAGMVRLVVTTQHVQTQVRDAAASLIRSAGFIALLAIAIGVVGAILLANIAILPIGRLVKAVSRIRDAEDKASLGGTTIPVRARDEIGTLAQTVNEMTSGLVTAAVAEREMLVGRAIQKQFLPLEPGADQEKGSTGGVKTPSIDLYAYYEGAAKVSGDYFDWQQLDDRYHALIKCDVSGHGVEAAFIMVEVATLFQRWSREWRERLAASLIAADAKALARDRLELQKLDVLVYTINDMIEERRFKGKFAAFMLCLYDTRTGLVTACSAGDNVLYRHDAAAGAMATQVIRPGNPAAGQIASDLIASANGFRSIQLKLEPSDVLLLFTDGFEESKHLFRNDSGERVDCADPSHADKKQDPLSTHKTGDSGEELSVSRIMDVFNAVFGKRTYRLVRNHVVRPETLEFDFSGCSNSLEEAVLALVAVERVFRTYRDPQTGPTDRIRIEAKVDRYLRRHFKQYDSYFGPQGEHDPAAEYIAISNMKEDPQDDDLTVVLLRRP